MFFSDIPFASFPGFVCDVSPQNSPAPLPFHSLVIVAKIVALALALSAKATLTLSSLLSLVPRVDWPPSEGGELGKQSVSRTVARNEGWSVGRLTAKTAQSTEYPGRKERMLELDCAESYLPLPPRLLDGKIWIAPPRPPP